MKKGGMGLVKKIIIVGIVLILLVFGYFIFFYSAKCDDLSCFFSHQLKCSRAKYIHDGKTITLEYRILGMHKGLCEINVKALLVKEGTLDKASLEGHSMRCYKEKGDMSYPESDLSKCHGRLKEQIQEIMIKKAHAEIVKNIGSISEEVAKVV